MESHKQIRAIADAYLKMKINEQAPQGKQLGDGEDEDTTGDTKEVVAGQLETPEERKKREALEAARNEGLYKLWRGF